MISTLPKPIESYLAGSNAGDASAVARAFTPDGTVRDERQTYNGRDAIQAWAADTIRRYGMRTEALAAEATDAGVSLKVRVSGHFPGSPIELEYRFRLGQTGIERLEVVA